MKKTILLSVLALGALTMNAQTVPVLRGGDFWDNWYVGGRAGATMDLSESGFFKSARPAFGLSIGKQWTPILGTEIQGLGFVNTTNSRTAIDATDVSLLGTLNLMNLFGGYEGIPRMFEIEAMAGIGWLHHYMNGPDDSNDLSSRAGLNLNFNLGESKAWTFSLRPAVAFNLTGDFPEKKVNFDKQHARFELLAGLTYHFSGGNGEHYFTIVPAADPLEIAAMNAEINGLRETVAAQEAALAGTAAEIATLQSNLETAQANATNNQPSAPVTSILESIVSFPFNESVIQPSQMPTIERVATYLKDHPGVNVVINGYASPEGTEAYNLKLSQRRADAMKDLLISKYGIAASRIDTVGHGVGDIFSEPAWNRVGICTIEVK